MQGAPETAQNMRHVSASILQRQYTLSSNQYEKLEHRAWSVMVGERGRPRSALCARPG
jgi:hypothetical protein